MFIWSLKTSKRELILLIIGMIMFIAAMIYVFYPRKESEAAALLEQGYTVDASNEAERKLFIGQFGWETEDDPVEVREIVIPVDFNDVYTKYNEIQTSQGFDLTKHRGEKVKHWTYRVTNYPDTSDVINANLLIKDGKVIGGAGDTLLIGSPTITAADFHYEGGEIEGKVSLAHGSTTNYTGETEILP